MSGADLFDAAASRQAREEGMARVTAGEVPFAKPFAAFVERLPSGWVGTCEDIRKVWPGRHPHPNAWGAAWNAAKRRGLLEELPTQVHMTAAKAHARKTHLHRRT